MALSTEEANNDFLEVDFGNTSLPCFSSFTVPVKLNFSINPNHKYKHLRTFGFLEISVQISVLHMSQDRSLDVNALKDYGSTCVSTVSSAGSSVHWKGNYLPGNKLGEFLKKYCKMKVEQLELESAWK